MAQTFRDFLALSDTVSYSLSLSRFAIEGDDLPTYRLDSALTVRIGDRIVFDGLVVFSSPSNLVLRSFLDYLTERNFNVTSREQ